MFTLPSSWYEWNTVERDVKPQLIYPSIVTYSTDDLSVYSVNKYFHARWQWNIVKVTSAAQLSVVVMVMLTD